MKILTILFLLLAFLGSTIAEAFPTVSQVTVTPYATTTVTTGAYVQLIASTPNGTRAVIVCDTSTHLLKLAIGAAGSEIDVAPVMVSGCVTIQAYIPQGTRISMKAIDASATTGYNVLTLVP